MLTEVRLENFKAFGREQAFELAPLTLIFGKNSVGKSTLIQALKLVAQSSRHHDWRRWVGREGRPPVELVPYLDGGEVDLGDAASCIHKSVKGGPGSQGPARIVIRLAGGPSRRELLRQWDGLKESLFKMPLGRGHDLAITPGGVGDRPGQGPTLRVVSHDDPDPFNEGVTEIPQVEWELTLTAEGASRDILKSGGVVWSSQRPELEQSTRELFDQHFFEEIGASLVNGSVHSDYWGLLLGSIHWILDRDEDRWFRDCGHLWGGERTVEVDGVRVSIDACFRNISDPDMSNRLMSLVLRQDDRRLPWRISDWGRPAQLNPQAGYVWLLAVNGVEGVIDTGMLVRIRTLEWEHSERIRVWLGEAATHPRMHEYCGLLRELLSEPLNSGLGTDGLASAQFVAVPQLDRLRRLLDEPMDVAAAGLALSRVLIEQAVEISAARVFRDSRYSTRLSNVEFVKAVRDEYPRFMRVSARSSASLGSNAPWPPQARPVGSISGQRYRQGDTEELNRVNDVLRSLEIPYELDRRVLASGHFWELVVRERSGGGYREMNLADVGFGIGQLVPLAMALVSQIPFTVIEEPEAHLHPGLQSKLGDLFIESIRPGNRGPNRDPKQVIVETHSEHLVLRVLRRIREGRIRPEQVSILYVDRVEGESTVQRLHVDEEGEFIDKWPYGFFEDRWEDLE